MTDDPRGPGGNAAPAPGPAPSRFPGHPRLDGHDAAAGTDTAGTTWQGRQVTGSPFAADEGAPDAAVRAALADLRDARGTATAESAAEARLVAALRLARVFAPIEAVAARVDEGGQGPDGGGLAREVVSQMASPVLTAPDGRRAMPVFSGMDTLAAWRPAARPVPVHAPEAARAAIEDSCDAMLLDLGTDLGHVLRLSQLWALAQGRDWLPAHDDPVVQAALARAVAGRPDIVEARLGDGSVHAAGVTRVVLTLRAGLAPEQVRTLAQAVGDALATDPDVRIRVDDVAMVLRSA